jgi:hypothetical protein
MMGRTRITIGNYSQQYILVSKLKIDPGARGACPRAKSVEWIEEL